MILPLRVLGRPATYWILSGLVMGLISAQTYLVKSMAMYGRSTQTESRPASTGGST